MNAKEIAKILGLDKVNFSRLKSRNFIPATGMPLSKMNVECYENSDERADEKVLSRESTISFSGKLSRIKLKRKKKK